jgi:hypothetical protein
MHHDGTICGAVQDAVVVAWRGGGRWLTYIWSVDQWVVGNQTALFTPGTGNQGGEGTDHGQQWYIEVWPSGQPARSCKTPCRLGAISQLLSRSRSPCGGPVCQNVLEELDDAREWYYDYHKGLLYYAFNGTAPQNAQWVATRTKVLFNVSGTPAAPAKDIPISGIQIRDTALTWLDPHGLPSGGPPGLLIRLPPPTPPLDPMRSQLARHYGVQGRPPPSLRRSRTHAHDSRRRWCMLAPRHIYYIMII